MIVLGADDFGALLLEFIIFDTITYKNALVYANFYQNAPFLLLKYITLLQPTNPPYFPQKPEGNLLSTIYYTSICNDQGCLIS